MSALAIEVVDLVKRFGTFTAVDGISLSVQRGEVFGFLGPNGCGKSTTIKMICGLLRPTAGKIHVDGLDVATQAEQVRARLGYVAQFFNLYRDLTVRENLSFYGGLYGVPRSELADRVEHWLTRLSLTAEADQRSGSLSTGSQRSVALAAAVLHQPTILLLDEPTSGVDPIARRAFFKVIDELAQGGASVLVTTHVMDEADRCHRLALMNRGRLVAEGTPSQIRAMAGSGLWQLAVQPASRALTLAESRSGVVSAALFGPRLQVRFGQEGAGVELANDLARWLEEQGIRVGQPEPVRPTIEHTFLRLLRESTSEQP